MFLHYVWSCFQPYTHWGRLSRCYFVRKQKLCLTQCTGIRATIQMQLFSFQFYLGFSLQKVTICWTHWLRTKLSGWKEKRKSLYIWIALRAMTAPGCTAPHKSSQSCQSFLYESWELSLADFHSKLSPVQRVVYMLFHWLLTIALWNIVIFITQGNKVWQRG